MVKKKEILLLVILFTIVLATFPLSIVKITDNKSKEVSEDHQVEALKTSEWNPGFNYTIIDNYPYSWIEINETGTNITSNFNVLDDGSAGISFSEQGWNFTFYGTEYDTINVSTNGFMSFSGQGYLGENNPHHIPQDCTQGSMEFHNDSVFLLHCDINLNPSLTNGGGSVFYEFKGAAPNRYLVIEYFQVNNYSTGGNLGELIGNFEVIFYENGDIKFQYKLVRELKWWTGAPDGFPVVGLDHGDLINYSNYTDNWNNKFTGDVEELAVYFRLNKNYTMDTNADYNWYDITRDGVHMKDLSNEDDDYDNITFKGQGWNFTFYDTEYEQISVSSNGWMSFPDQGETYEWADDIPSNMPENQDCVSLLCTDIDLDEGGDIYYYFGGSNPNRYLIIEYYRAYEWDSWDLIGDFEVIFYESGNIKFQYKLATDIAYDLTPIIGLDHGDLSYYNNYSATFPLTSKAIKFTIEAGAEDHVDFVASPPFPPSGGDDDDDDDGEVAIPGYDLFLILLAPLLAVIVIAKKFRKNNN